MRLTVTTQMTIDGVIQAPGGPQEDTSGGFTAGGWAMPYFDEEGGAIVSGWFEQADAFLLGRRTYEIFAGHWPNVPDENPIAAALNRLPKHVASTTLSEPAWAGASVIEGDLREAVLALKAREGRELQVHGSVHLVQWLIANDLVDELRLVVIPVALGTGRRLFEAPEQGRALELLDSRRTASGVTVLIYRPDGAPKQGSFEHSPEPENLRILR
jgi:dihydrofolate reductase